MVCFCFLILLHECLNVNYRLRAAEVLYVDINPELRAARQVCVCVCGKCGTET
jgi:hypothetical protein